MCLPPAFALVVRAINFAAHAAVVANEVENIRVGRRDGDSHSSNLLAGWKPRGQLFPCFTRVGRFVDSASGTGNDVVPGFPVTFPGDRIQRLVVGWIDCDFHHTNLL